jgi:signal transduction histidine kinase
LVGGDNAPLIHITKGFTKKAKNMENDGKLLNVSKRFLQLFLPLFIIATLISAGFLSQEISSQKKVIKAEELRKVELLKGVATNDIKSVIADLLFLSTHNVLNQLLENDKQDINNKLSKIFLHFCKAAVLYDQVRFLDETGMERIRVNFGNGRPYIVDEKNLQNKAKRYYFADTFKLKPGWVFMSPLDLNIEKGQIEQPQKPMIRFGTPVVDIKGQKRGVVLLNYFGATLIKNIDRASFGTLGTWMLLNQEGYWLKGIHPEDEWGFMYKERKNRSMGRLAPQAWQKISSLEGGQFLNDQGVYTFSTIWPLGHGMLSSTGSEDAFETSQAELSSKEYYWKAVSFISAKELGQQTTTTLLFWFPVYIFLVIFLSFVSWGLSIAALRTKQAQEALRKATAFETLNTVLESFISDSLANLLTPIYINVEMCKLQVGIDQIESQLQKIEKNITRLLTGINAYRRFSALGEDSLGCIGLVDLKPVLDRLLSGQPLKTYKGEEFPINSNIDLRFVYDPKESETLTYEKLPPVLGTETGIAMALQETIINAIESYNLDEGGKVTVSAKKKDHNLIIEIADKGRGMSKDDTQKSQLPFFKILGMKTSGRFGLGAYIACESAKYCKGNIQLVSKKGVGTTAFIILKANDPHANPI